MGEFWQKHQQAILVVALLVIAFVTVHFAFSKGNLDKDTLLISTTYDNFYHPAVSKGIADQEHQMTYPAYRALGVKHAVIADPPLHFSIPASFAKIVRMPFYQAYFFVSLMLILWTSASVFVLVRRAFGSTPALIALAFGLIPSSAIWLFPLTIGFTPTFEAFFFFPIIIFLWGYSINNKSMFAAILAGVALGAQFLTHGPFEAGLALVFLTVVTIFAKIEPKTESWKYFFSVMITAGIISLYQYLLLRLTRITGENIIGTLFASNPVPAYFPRVVFGLIVAGLSIAGLIAIVLSLISKKLDYEKGILIGFIGFLAAFGLSSAVGVDGSRAYRMFYVAYPFFAIWPALGITAIWNHVKIIFPARLSSGFVVVVLALIAGFSVQPLAAGLAPIASGGLATPERMQALHWVRDNTPVDAVVFYLFGFEHELEMLGERVPFKGDLGLAFTQRNIMELCNAQFPQNFSGHWGGAITTREQEGKLLLPVKKGLFDVELAVLNRPNTDEPLTPQAEDRVPLSGFDYVVFQEHGTQADPCMAFFLNQSVSRGAKVAWRNSQFAIIEVHA